MKIALVRQRYTPFGGAERFVANAMRALDADGVSLTMVTRRWPSGAEFEPLICNPFYLGNVWRDKSFARCVCHSLATRDFDLVQSHERIPCCDIYRAGDGVHREWLAQRRRILGPLGKLSILLNPYHRHVLAALRRGLGLRRRAVDVERGLATGVDLQRPIPLRRVVDCVLVILGRSLLILRKTLQ